MLGIRSVNTLKCTWNLKPIFLKNPLVKPLRSNMSVISIDKLFFNPLHDKADNIVPLFQKKRGKKEAISLFIDTQNAK